MPVHNLRHRVRRSHPDHRDRQARPARRRLRHRPLRRHHAARHGQPLGAATRARLLPAHGRVRGADVRRGQDPGRLHQARVAPVRGGHPRRPPDRPAHPAALPRGLQGRRPARPDGPVHGPGERSRHPRHDRRVGRADHQRDPVQWPRRRGARRPHQRRVRDQPHLQPARRVGYRPRRLGHARRDHDGRGRRQDPARGRDGRGDHVRPPLAAAAHRPPGAAARAGRQAQAHAVHRARHRLASLDFVEAVDGERDVRRLRRRDHQPRRQAGPTSSRSAPSRSKAARSTTAGPRSSTPGAPIVGSQLHGITDEDVKDARRRGRGRAASSTGRATRSLVGHNVGFDLGFLEAALGTATSSSRAATSTRSSSPARPTRTRTPTSWATSRASSSSPSSPTTARCPTPRPPPQLLIRLAERPAGRIETLKDGVADAIRARASGGDQGRCSTSARRRKIARLLQGPVRAAPQEGRPRAGAQRGHPHGRPRHRHHPADHGRGRRSCRAPMARPCSPAARRRR